MNARLLALWFILMLAAQMLYAQRVPVLPQVKLSHNYYYRELYLPQLTSGPSSVAWSPDGKFLVYSMAGNLWLQEPEGKKATQLTDGDGYDYQPDWSPDGRHIIFVRYNGASVELMLLEVATRKETTLTASNEVILEPRWSPDGHSIVYVSTAGTGHFLLYKSSFSQNRLTETTCLTPDRKSEVPRYYYSPYDHAINPAWSPDGSSIYFVSNREVAHGSGDIVKINSATGDDLTVIRQEETSWKARPDVSPDGSRIVYSSYLGRNWHQLWMLPAAGGYAMPLTYGDYDNTSPRWSPDGNRIAFISNRNGNTSLWLVNVWDGKQTEVIAREREYLMPHVPVFIQARDQDGLPLAARISVTDSRGKFHAPSAAWIQADDSHYPAHQRYEAHYFHYNGTCRIVVPKDQLTIHVSHGPEYEPATMQLNAGSTASDTVTAVMKKLSLPAGFGYDLCADLHVHMNYTGHYLSMPSILVEQARAEDVDMVFNLIVNKEQRIPDVNYFRSGPDPASTGNTMLLHAQEFHTSYWGHLGLLGLADHLILPDYAGYPQTAAASIFPHNGFIADRAHKQQALTGYVHPFEQSEIFPSLSATLTNELPVDAALGKVDYYELVGFSDHRASEFVWYKLLNCGLHIPAGAGTDFMANYASLRGPVGLNRMYVKGMDAPDEQRFLRLLKEGRSFVTNGPLIGLSVAGAEAGDTIFLNAKNKTVDYTAFLRSNIPVDHFEIIFNGEVVAQHTLKSPAKTLDVSGRIKLAGPGWLLLRAYSDTAHPDLPDIYAYASTNPIYITDGGGPALSKEAAAFFLHWIDQLETKVASFTSFRNEAEKAAILTDLQAARKFYEGCVKRAE